MRIKLEDIKGCGLKQAYSCTLADFPEIAALAQDNGPLFHEPLRFFLRLQRTGELVEVDGRCQAQVTLHCSRCLQPLTLALDEAFSVTFAPEERREGDAPADDVELEREELGLIAYRDDSLELRDALQEQLIMALPIRPLCTENCAGLCPVCGIDLNRQRCDCIREPFNNRFAALADLKLPGKK